MALTYTVRGDFVLIREVLVPPKVSGGWLSRPTPGRTDLVVVAKGPGVPVALTVGSRVILHQPRPEDTVGVEKGVFAVHESQIAAVVTGEE